MAGRENDVARKRQERRLARDIGEIPKVKKPYRRGKCKNNLGLFLSVYFSNYAEMGEPHKRAISMMQDSILHGKLFALAMSRGHGKSTLAESAVIWAWLYGHRKYILLIQSNDRKAKRALRNIKRILEANPLLQADFPEVCYPVRCLEGQIQRQKSQLCRGELTELDWGSRLVVPTVAESRRRGSSGSIIETVGITGSMRGSRDVSKDNEILRPDFFVADDVQDREQAKSDDQTDDAEKILTSDVMGLGGYDVSICGFCLCTVIRSGDLASRLLSHEKHPEWRGETTGYFEEWPRNWELWQEWLRLNGIEPEEADRYYASHKTEMSEGAVVTWPARHLKGEDGILSGMRHYAKLGEKQFFSEYQNTPIEDVKRAYSLTPEIVESRVADTVKMEIPPSFDVVTCFADVMLDALRYMVVAFRNDMTAVVIDYGAYPPGGCVWDPGKPGGLTENQAVATAVSKFLDMMEEKKYLQSGKPIGIRIAGIDRGFADSAVKDGASKKRTFNVRLSLGRANKNKGRGFGGFTIPKDAIARDNCYEKTLEGALTIVHNSDVWRKNVQQAFLLETGVSGSCSIYSSKAGHRELALQISNEQLVEQIKDEYIWKELRKNFDHYLDCLVGCYVMANREGCSFSGGKPPTKRKIKMSHGGGIKSTGGFVNGWR